MIQNNQNKPRSPYSVSHQKSSANKSTSIYAENSMFQSNPSSSWKSTQQMMAQIKATTQTIKQKTINLVNTLRQHSIPAHLELQIEGYLTDVLDQMDLLQSMDAIKQNKGLWKQLNYEAVPFLPMEKPQGDQEECLLEDTLRELSLNNLKSSSEQIQLHDKIEHILKSISQASMEEDPLQDSKPKQQQQPEINGGSESRSKGAHRFSNLYIRDFQKAKRGKLL